MLSDKYLQKAELKEKELNLRKMELEFEREKYNAEAGERKGKESKVSAGIGRKESIPCPTTKTSWFLNNRTVLVSMSYKNVALFHTQNLFDTFICIYFYMYKVYF